jgi:3-dehydroquinate synthase
MQQVYVNLSDRSYSIWIGSNAIPEMAQQLMLESTGWKHAALVVDSHLVDSLGRAIAAKLKDHDKRVSMLEVPSGEGSKSIEQLALLWEQLCECKTDRKSILIAVGGGVVGDLAGFAAASYMRGLRFVQVPTTLLAMVDSSVGGKTGINLPTAKNMVGAFWQPHAVWIDTQTLNSLPDREYRSGLAEVVKYGIILDATFFEYLERNASALLERDVDALQTIIRRSCELKAHVVAHDERETTGLRAILNYGHTFGHAIEATTSYGQFLHGEAISIGMTMAGHLARMLGRWDDASVNRQTALLRTLKLPISTSASSPEALMGAMQLDKKTEHGKLNFILPTRIGHVETVQGVDPGLIRSAIHACA